jgi:hypothetical protein
MRPTKRGRARRPDAPAGLRGAYNSWRAARERCTYPRHPFYADYGGRGIAVCARWASFDAFFADMGERPAGTTLDRVDVDGDYEPANCRWSTSKAQRWNRRDMAARREFDGFYEEGEFEAVSGAWARPF